MSYLKGALFADAGNIWLMNENPDLPGGQFTSDWQQELAVGAGLGLRLDLDVLVIRLAVSPDPFGNPYTTQGDHAVDNVAFNKLVWNFAIGYPF
ncbi:MAG: BamA/TamA family outer membrane protein [Owenweeksia sp.]|nr:BamA/TamA family outer membrane protein [Owenweeksia sp.]